MLTVSACYLPQAIGSRNLLKSVTQQREAEKMQLLSQIVEKQTRLERLRVQQSALTKMQNEQEQVRAIAKRTAIALRVGDASARTPTMPNRQLRI